MFVMKMQAHEKKGNHKMLSILLWHEYKIRKPTWERVPRMNQEPGDRIGQTEMRTKNAWKRQHCPGKGH